MDALSIAIGKKIQLIRDSEGLSRARFSSLTGISADTLKGYESGKSKSVHSTALEKITKHPRFEKYTLWLMTGKTNPAAGQIAPGEEVQKMAGTGVPVELLNQAFERTITTAIELEWMDVSPSVPYSMLADLFRRDFVEAGGVIVQQRQNESKTG